MLVLSRQRDETIRITLPEVIETDEQGVPLLNEDGTYKTLQDTVDVIVVDITGSKTRLGFVCSPEVRVDRLEVFNQRQQGRSDQGDAVR